MNRWTLSMKIFLVFTFLGIIAANGLTAQDMPIAELYTLPDLGAAQGVSKIGDQLYIYGDREVGMMRRYSLLDSLVYSGDEYQFTLEGKDLINHPTGIAYAESILRICSILLQNPKCRLDQNPLILNFIT